METIILASGSPRRRELLSRVGIPFEVYVPDVEETTSLPADTAVEELCRRKAIAAFRVYSDHYVLAADTLVSLDGRALGKPADEAEAAEMLRSLSGRTHQVHTGVTVISPFGNIVTEADHSSVTFCDIPPEEIASYVASGEPLDKAGAYAIQGRASLWITRLEGSDTSVVGLPLYLVRRLLLLSGYPLSFAP